MSVNILIKRSDIASKRPVGSSLLPGELALNYDAETGGLYYADTNGDVVKVGPCQVSSTAPNSSPAGSPGNSVGEFWFNTADSSLNVWNGTAWVETNVGSAVQSVTGTLPITVDDTDPTNPVIEIGAASTTAPGAVQLNDTVTSTSTSQAATANAVKTAYDAATAAVQTVAGTTPVQVDNTDPQNLVVSVDAATTGSPGIVQLNNTTSSTSTTEALTANQGYLLQQQIDALVITNNLTLAGTYDASSGLVDAVTTEGAGVGFVVGDPLPTPDAGNAGYFVIVDVQGSTGPTGTPPYHIGDWFLSDGTAYQFLNVGYQAAYASTSAPGIIQLATDAEVQAGTDTTLAVVPSSLQSKISDSTSTTSSTTIASSTAVKSAYDLASAAMPISGGTFTGSVTFSEGADAGGIETTGTITPGTGYTVGTYNNVTLTGGTGTGAVGNVEVTEGPPGVTAVSITDPGNNYPAETGVFTNASTVAITGSGTGLRVTFSYLENSLTGISAITNPGTGYDVGDTFYVGTGRNGVAEVTAIGTTGNVTGFTLVSPGSGYTVNNNLTGTLPGGGTGWRVRVASVTTGSAVTTIDSTTQVNGPITFATTPIYSANVGDAVQVVYDNAVSGLVATNVQSAIDELDGLVETATVWTETAGVLTPATENAVVSIDVPMGIDGVTVTDSVMSISTLIAPAQAIFLDNIQSVTVSGSDSLITHVIDSTTGSIPGILAVDEAANPAPYNLQIGELQLNGDAGTSGYVLQSNGPGSAPTWVANASGDVTSVTGTSPITVDNTDAQNPVIGIEAASTAQAGAVQLYDDVDSTSNTLAATANAVKIAYDAATSAAAAGLPTTGGTMTGNITFSTGTTVEFEDTAPVSISAVDQLATVIDGSNGNLSIVPGFDAGTY